MISKEPLPRFVSRANKMSKSSQLDMDVYTYCSLFHTFYINAWLFAVGKNLSKLPWAEAFGVQGLSLELRHFMRLMAGLLGAALLTEPVSHRRLWNGLKPVVVGPSPMARWEGHVEVCHECHAHLILFVTCRFWSNGRGSVWALAA